MRFAAPYRWLVTACLCAAEFGCTGGLAIPITLADASPGSEAGASAGSAGSANPPKGGRGGLPFGGAPGIGTGGTPDNMGFNCGMESDDASVVESEALFRKLLNEAIQAGDPPFCIGRPLENRSEFRCIMVASAFALASVVADPRIPRVLAPPEGWALEDRWIGRHAESAADAKNQLLSEMATRSNGYRAFCAAAAEERYTGVVVARSSNSWAVGFVPD